jgi:outer membrane protein TolC
MPPRLVGSILVVALVLAGPSAAEEAPAPPPSEPPTLHGALELSLADAIAMGIENNLDVEIARYEPLIAEADVESAWGAYDPELFADYGYSSQEVPNTNPLLGEPGAAEEAIDIVTTRTLAGNAGVRGLTPGWGARYALLYAGTSTEYSTGFFDLSPEYRADLALTATLPFLRDLIWNEPWTQVKLSGSRYQGSLEDFRRRLMDTVGGVPQGPTGVGTLEATTGAGAQDPTTAALGGLQGVPDPGGIVRAYWNLVAREEDLRVAEKSLEARRALLTQAEAQYEVGVESRVAVVEAEAGVAERELNRIRAQNRYREAQDRLINLVLGPHLTADSRLEIRPTDRPERLYQLLGGLVLPDVEEAAQLASENRPELEILRRQIEQNKIELQFRRNQRLPRLDAVASGGYQGLSGGTNPHAPPFCGNPDPVTGLCPPRTPIPIDRRYTATDDDFFSDDGAFAWSAGGVFSFPLGNRQASGRADRAALDLRRSRTRLRRLEQDILLQVRKAVRDLASSAEGIDAAERRRLAAEEQLRAETIRLEHGESTPFEVLQREEDLVEAESQKIAAHQLYRDSLTALERAQGTILRDHNVVVDDARALR